MKRIFILLSAIILTPMLLCGAGETRIGYVDVDRVTSKAKPVNNLMGGAAEEIKKLQQDIESKTKQVTDMEAEIKRTDGVLSKEETDKKRKEVLRLRNEVDDLMTKARQKSREVESTVYEPLLKKIGGAIQEVAKERNIEIVLPGAAVLYGSPAADMTDDVIKKLNEDATSAIRAGAKEEPKTSSGTQAAAPADPAAAAAKSAPPAAVSATPIAGTSAKSAADAQPAPAEASAPAPTPESAEPAPAKTTEAPAPTAEPASTPAKERASKSDAKPKSAKKTPAVKSSPTRASGTRPVDRQPE